MEEKIFEIIGVNCEHFAGIPIKCSRKLAREIASGVKEFMEFISTEGWQFHQRQNTWVYANRIGVVRKSIDELFDYWYNNVYKK